MFQYKAIIFDVDGTLIDGTEGILSSIKKTIAYFNIPSLSDEKLCEFIGPPVQDSCEKILKLDKNKSQEFTNYFRQTLIKYDLYKAKVYDKIDVLLKFFNKEKFNLGVATYKREDLTKSLMKHFGFDKYFTSICGSDNENKFKKIDILKNCIEELNANKEQTIFIGDSYHDGVAAKELGVGFIGVTYGFGFKTKEEIKEYNPILSVDRVDEIIEYFAKEEISV